jgi:thioredoxin reductase (NADPH)
MDVFAGHAERFGAQIAKDEVVAVDFSGAIKVVTGKKADYGGRAVILSPGAEPRVLGIKGERAFRGKGVSYCATCDADFYTDLDVVVVGNGDAAIEEAMYLTKFAESVAIVVIHEEGVLDATKVIQERAFANPKISWVWNSVLEEIRGDGLVEEAVIRNIRTGALTVMPTNGVFFFVGTVPKTGFLEGHVEMDRGGYIITSDLMETSADGVYAAGDARQKYLRQVVTAAADGAIAATAAEKYLQEEEGFRRQVTEAGKPVLVYFWAPQNDESVKAMAVLDDVQSRVDGRIGFYKIDTYRNKRVAGRYGVTSIPSAVIVSGTRPVARIGRDELTSAARLLEVVESALALDLRMDR